MKNSAKNKIFLGIFVWLILCFIMFGWVFKKFRLSNQVILESLAVLKKEEAILEAERQSFLQARNDLDKLSKAALQPTDFFSKDITLENIAKDLSVQMNLSGVSGTTKSGQAAGTKTDMIRIPFSLSLQGSLANVVSFMEYLENLEFITPVQTVSINSGGVNNVAAALSASFYVKR